MAQADEVLSTKERRAAQAAATRAALIAAARELFVAKGYHQTGTEEIVAAAAITRGALYHHFADKQALFEAVFIGVEEELVATAAASLSTLEDGSALGILRHGLIGFLDASLTTHVQQILLLDGPAVLGWRRWRELEGLYGLGAIQAMLQRAVEEGDLPADQPVELMAHVLLAAADEAALFIANSADQQRARDEAVQTLDALIAGLQGSRR